MANPTITRMSPAELRRRLLAPPTDAAPSPPIAEEPAFPAMPARMPKRSDVSRFGGSMPTQTALGLDGIEMESSGPLSSRLTQIPESRLDPSQFRTFDAAIARAQPAPSPYSADSDEVGFLRAQNAELTRLIEEMKPVLEEASAQELRIQLREQETQAQISERDQKIQELEQKLADVPPPRQPKTRDELEEWSDELEQENAKLTQERRTLSQERQQLREDEEALEKQMRDMECSMARERAQMARQETELKRLSAEIQHELEMLQRGDGNLRDQLSKFQRRHQEVISRTPGGAPLDSATEPSPAAPNPKDSTLFGRIFRGR